jgi:hypothetical protein
MHIYHHRQKWIFTISETTILIKQKHIGEHHKNKIIIE